MEHFCDGKFSIIGPVINLCLPGRRTADGWNMSVSRIYEEA